MTQLQKDESGRSILGYALYDPTTKEWLRLDKRLFANPHSAKCGITLLCKKNKDRKFAMIVPILLPDNPEETGFTYASPKVDGSVNEMAGYLLERDLLDE